MNECSGLVLRFPPFEGAYQKHHLEQRCSWQHLMCSEDLGGSWSSHLLLGALSIVLEHKLSAHKAVRLQRAYLPPAPPPPPLSPSVVASAHARCRLRSR